MRFLSLVVVASMTLSCSDDVRPLGGFGGKVRGATSAERLTEMLGDIRSQKPHDTLMESLLTATGPVLVDSPDRVEGLDALTVKALITEENQDAWWGKDEVALAGSLREDNVRYIVLHRDAKSTVDRDGTVLSRLYYDDSRVMFSLVAVDENFLLYRVLDKPREFPMALAHHTLEQLRKIIKGEPALALPDIAAGEGKKWQLVALARRPGGRAIAVGLCNRDTYRDCVAELARDLEREYRRYAEWDGLPRLEDTVDDLILELHRIVDRARIEAWEKPDLLDLWEMGVDGGLIVEKTTRKGAETTKVGVLPGSVAYARAIRDPEILLKTVAKSGRLGSSRAWREKGNRLEKIRTLAYSNWPGRGTFAHLRGVRYVPMAAVDLPALEGSVVLSGEWYLANLQDNGQVTYKFWPSENRYSNEYNLVRHTLATWNLVQAWHIENRPEFLDAARRAQEWTLQFLVEEGDMSFIDYNNNRKLGSVVVALMGMIELAQATGSTEWDDLMERFGNFTLFMQEDSGKFDPYYVPDDHPYANNVNDIVPGEAALALVMLHEYTGDDKWLGPLPKFFEYYMPWWEERVAKRREGMRWPFETYYPGDRLELVQFGPWSVMAANAYHRVSGDKVSADFGLNVARWMIDTYQWTEERAPWPDYVGGYYKMPNELPAMQAFCYAEGTSAAYQLALRHAPEQAAFFEEHTRQSMRFALQMQYDDMQVYPFSRAGEVRGGTRYAMNETKVRIDYVHHQLSSVYQYIMAAREDPNLPENVKVSPIRRQLEALRAQAEELPSGG
ncbi:MAG: hypothetical protein VX519_00545 [Myxococcota bacterium]|nr:hypothetical protein [Myxococcota bacterium]